MSRSTGDISDWTVNFENNQETFACDNMELKSTLPQIWLCSSEPVEPQLLLGPIWWGPHVLRSWSVLTAYQNGSFIALLNGQPWACEMGSSISCCTKHEKIGLPNEARPPQWSKTQLLPASKTLSNSVQYELIRYLCIAMSCIVLMPSLEFGILLTFVSKCLSSCPTFAARFPPPPSLLLGYW